MGRFPVIIGFIFLVFLSKGQKKEERGLIAKYTFNKGDARDDVGKNDAKAYGVSLTEDRFGNPDMAYYFHGNAASFLNLGTSKLLKPQKGTISVWLNIHTILGLGKGTETNPVILTSSHTGEDCNTSYFIGFDLNTRKINGNALNSCSDGTTVYSQKRIPLAQWHHAVLTYDNKNTSLYLNGIIQDKVPKNFTSMFVEGDSVVVGTMQIKKNVRYFLGCIDDIQIYDRVLSADEIKELYNAPNPQQSKIFLKWAALVAAIIAFTLIIVLLIRRRIHFLVNKEKEKNHLQNRWYEQENRVLSAQMDPHFIFNSLNTIQQFIITLENEKAQLYLSKFSRLMRKILESNSKEQFSLKEEIEIIEKYLEIESLRFNNAFSYKITVKDDLNTENTFIPHFLIQPLVENAIWHGLLPKEENRQLDITFEKQDDKTLLCVVEDNGVGRKKNKKSENDEQKSSLAINFIEQRLNLMSKMYTHKYSIEIIDKVDTNDKRSGTKVIITMPILSK